MGSGWAISIGDHKGKLRSSFTKIEVRAAMGKVPESSQQEPVVDFVVAARWVGMNTILVYLMAASGAFFERAQVWVQNPENECLPSVPVAWVYQDRLRTIVGKQLERTVSVCACARARVLYYRAGFTCMEIPMTT
jgi:hypothetical protein